MRGRGAVPGSQGTRMRVLGGGSFPWGSPRSLLPPQLARTASHCRLAHCGSLISGENGRLCEEVTSEGPSQPEALQEVL